MTSFWLFLSDLFKWSFGFYDLAGNGCRGRRSGTRPCGSVQSCRLKSRARILDLPSAASPDAAPGLRLCRGSESCGDPDSTQSASLFGTWD